MTGMHDEIRRLTEERDRLATALREVIRWLDMIAEKSEQQARYTTFETLRDAWIADAKNYRATAKDLRATLQAKDRP